MDERMPSAANGETQARDAQLWENALRNALNRLGRRLFAEGLLEQDGLLWACDGHQAWLPFGCHATCCISPTCVVHLPEHCKIGVPSKCWTKPIPDTESMLPPV